MGLIPTIIWTQIYENLNIRVVPALKNTLTIIDPITLCSLIS